ncbi:MAG: hypothetical protein JW699_00850 [Chitinispirillaceae bacterium]|nr:hypothetical protein [Chitinispirillaceae bacterium]
MRYILLIFSIFIITNGYAEIRTEALFQASFGNKPGQFGTAITGEPVHGVQYPLGLYVADNQNIYISDCHNQRIQYTDSSRKNWYIIQEGQNKEIYTTSCDEIVFVSLNGFLIINSGIVYNPLVRKWGLLRK